MYYDSHTHLNDDKLFDNVDFYIKEFFQGWWKWLVNVWASDIFNQRAVDIAKQYQDLLLVKASIWYDPYSICFDSIDFDIDNIKNLYLQNKEYIVWIWECGIDTHFEWFYEKLNSQKNYFAQQCDLAAEFNLPVIIHSRQDFDSTFDVLKNYKNNKIYFHCWGYGPDELKKIQNYFPNLWVGFAGNITYPKAQDLRDSFKLLDTNKILLETDAPYLTPQAVRWETNKPIYVKYIYDYISEQFWIDKNKLSLTIENNFKNLFSL